MIQATTNERRTIQSLDRAFDIIDLLAQHPASGLSLKGICAVVGLNPSTAHHLISTMAARQYLEQDPASRRYRLGSALLRLRDVVRESLDMQQLAQRFAMELGRRTGENVYVSVLGGWRIDNLSMVPSAHPIRFVRPSDSEPSLHATASGKCLLAFQPDAVIERFLREIPRLRFTPNTIVDADHLRAELKRIRATKVAVDLEEHVLGVSCIAAPIFDDHDAAVAALSIDYPVYRVDAATRTQWMSAVCACATEFSAALGFAASNGAAPVEHKH